MKAHDLPEECENQSRCGKGQNESYERYGESSVRDSIERFSESRASRGSSEIYFVGNPVSYERRSPNEKHEVRNVLALQCPHAFDSKLFRISGKGEGKEVSVSFIRNVDFLIGKQRALCFVRIVRLASNGGFEKLGGPLRVHYDVVGFFDFFPMLFEKGGIVFRSRQ